MTTFLTLEAASVSACALAPARQEDFADIIVRGAGHTTTDATKALLAEYGYTPKF